MIAADADDDLYTAETLLNQSLTLYQDLRFPRFIALLLLSLGDVAGAQQDYSRSRGLLIDGLSAMRDAGEKLGLHGALDSLARLAASTADASLADQHFVEAWTSETSMTMQQAITDALEPPLRPKCPSRRARHSVHTATSLLSGPGPSPIGPLPLERHIAKAS